MDWKVIEKCVEGHEGVELLVAHGDDSRKLHPKISFVPTVVLNGKQPHQDDIHKNLLRHVCKEYHVSYLFKNFLLVINCE